MGKHSENPILNTLMDDVEFPDGTIRPYAALNDLDVAVDDIHNAYLQAPSSE